MLGNGKPSSPPNHRYIVGACTPAEDLGGLPRFFVALLLDTQRAHTS